MINNTKPGRMTQPVDQIAEKLIAAAYTFFGNPGEKPGGDYIDKVTAETDVPAYFRHIAKLAAAPRSMDVYAQYRREQDDGDAAMVMNAGLDCLLEDAALPAEQRRVIEQIKALEEETRKADEAILEQCAARVNGRKDDAAI